MIALQAGWLYDWIAPVLDMRKASILLPGPTTKEQFYLLWDVWRFRASAAVGFPGDVLTGGAPFRDRVPVWSIDIVELVLVPLLEIGLEPQLYMGDGVKTRDFDGIKLGDDFRKLAVQLKEQLEELDASLDQDAARRELDSSKAVIGEDDIKDNNKRLAKLQSWMDLGERTKNDALNLQRDSELKGGKAEEDGEGDSNKNSRRSSRKSKSSKSDKEKSIKARGKRSSELKV